jgi:hypothetical protein
MNKANTQQNETLRAIDNLECLSDKELDELYNATRPVKAKRQSEHEQVRREMIKRGNLIGA